MSEEPHAPSSNARVRETPFTVESESHSSEEGPKKPKDPNIIDLIKQNPLRLK